MTHLTQNFITNSVGIDVSKDTLDVFLKQSQQTFQVENSQKGINKLIKKLTPAQPQLTVLEATGGFEQLCANTMLGSGLKVAIANPKRVRDFAKAMGVLAKTDNIDARVIADYASVAQLEPLKPISEQQASLKPLLLRRA